MIGQVEQVFSNELLNFFEFLLSPSASSLNKAIVLDAYKDCLVTLFENTKSERILIWLKNNMAAEEPYVSWRAREIFSGLSPALVS